MTEKKITKKEHFTAIAEYLRAEGHDTWAEVVEKEIAALERKAAKAKETAAKAKAANDELTEIVQAALTEEPTLIADIAAKVEFPGSTLSKVQYRLTALVKAGVAVKSEITVPGGEGVKARKLSAYSLAIAE